MRTDVCVIGGGSGGFGAALAAARQGLAVVLVEAGDCLGGNSVRGGVNCWERGAGGTGFPFELYLRLQRIPNAIGICSMARHGSWPHPDPVREPFPFPGGEQVIDAARRYSDTLVCHGAEFKGYSEAFVRRNWHGLPFEPDLMAREMRALLAETGRCTVRLNTALAAAERDGRRVTSASLSDGTRIEAETFIDSSGNAALCAAAGAEILRGEDPRSAFAEPHAPEAASPRVNGVTLCYRVNRAAAPLVEPLPAGIAAECWWRAEFPWMCLNQYPSGDRNVNMLPTMDGAEYLRLGPDAAYAECRRRALAHWHWLQASFEEFRFYRLARIFPALGVRESARVRAEHMLTEHDVVAGFSRQTHPDVIAVADHGMDVHGEGGGYRNLDEPYGVPFRSLVVRGFDNLLVACRCAGFSAIAASSCRLSRTMMQLGQAAGTAAGVAHRLGVPVAQTPPAPLRAALRAQHAQVDWPTPPALQRRLEAE